MKTKKIEHVTMSGEETQRGLTPLPTPVSLSDHMVKIRRCHFRGIEFRVGALIMLENMQARVAHRERVSSIAMLETGLAKTQTSL